ncbi:choice-of-anchor G family protein [Leucobacter sp. USHLN153]|uniref:choice-of-anchor G family protein n=1 Tax=Leucobacter sp. USHLN153 TaxID=3081268 RepID=UPI0030168864
MADPQTPSATAESAAHAHGLFVDGLGLDIVDSAGTVSEYPDAPSPEPNGLNLELLQTLNITAGDVNIPLLATPEQAGLLSLGDLGTLSSYSASSSASTSVASSGVITDEGAIDLGPVEDPTSFNPASVNASSLVREVLGDETADALLDDATLSIGALASRVEAEDGVATSEYSLTGLDLQISSPFVDGLVDDLDTFSGTLIDPIEALLAEDGSVEQIVSGLADTIDALPLTTASVDSLGLDTSSLTTELRAQLLETPLQNTDGSVTVDLDAGTIGVDLDRLVVEGADAESLSDLGPNTEVLSGPTVDAILDGVTDALLGGGTNSLVSKATTLIEQGIYGVGVNASLQVGLEADVLGAVIPVANGPLAISGTIGGILDQPGYAPLDVDAEGVQLLGGLPSPVDLGALLDPVLDLAEGVLSSITGAIVTPASNVVDDVEDDLNAFLTPLVTELLDEALEPVLEQVLAVTINEQPSLLEGGVSDLGPEGFTTRALSISVLPLLGEGSVDVELGSSTVFPAAPAAVAVLNASPNPVEQGGVVTLTGGGFESGEDVTVTLPDGSTTTLTAGEDGTISTTWDVPAAYAPGTATFTATGGTSGLSATTTTEVIAASTATLQATPNPVQQGGTVTLSGGGFDSGEDVVVTLPDGEETTVTAEEDGSFSTTWDVPADFTPGTATFTATGETSGLSATATTVVEAADGDADANVNASASASASADAAADNAATASAQAAAQAAANANNTSDASAAADVTADAAAAVAANANASSEASARSNAAAAAAAMASANSTANSAANADASAAATASANADATAAASAASDAAATATSSADASAAASADVAADASATASASSNSSSTSNASGSASASASSNGGPNHLVNTGGSSPLVFGIGGVVLLLVGAGVMLATRRRKMMRRG